MLKIYGQTRSRAFRVLWLCKESNIPFEQKPISIHVPDAQCKEEWYVKLNPNARIPTIDDDGFVMWESGVRKRTVPGIPGTTLAAIDLLPDA